MDAIILAGASPDEKDPLYDVTHGGNKALLPICGRPMINYVVDAVAGMKQRKNVVLVGLPADAPVTFPIELARLPNQGGIMENLEAGLNQLKTMRSTSDYTIIVTGDIPLLKSAMIDAHLARCFETEHDFYFTVIAKSIMNTRFPASQRSFVLLKEGKFCGGDLHVLRRSQEITNRELWRKLTATRKNAFKQVSMIGLRTLLKVMSGQMTIPEGEERFGRLFNARARAILSHMPELGMDVDKPFQIPIVERELERQAEALQLARAQH